MPERKPRRELTGHQARYGFAYMRVLAEDREAVKDLAHWGIDKTEKRMVEAEVQRLLMQIIELRLRRAIEVAELWAVEKIRMVLR
jgi:hypothetical protein